MNDTLLMVRGASVPQVTSVVRKMRVPSFDHSASSVPLQLESTIGCATASATTSSSMPRVLPTTVCMRTPFFSGVMHIRAPVPVRSSSRRQHPIQAAKRASTCGVAARGAGDCANTLEAVNVNARTIVVFICVSLNWRIGELEGEMNSGAEAEST